ncbi:hypothetical protein [Granulicella mallensis]|uniref:DUF1795 domain-containing protein n=1 Tax=Granulicella mallensis TaxID=940614 RepID=A0A7W7ZQZ2_9BACT|nr:hypothetical protein [Granulicella mallensis]MBB5064198.1 hypothetical protein [Granulicella mallensis]
MTVGRWRITVLPKGWSPVADFGIRQDQSGSGSRPANVSLREDLLKDEDTLSAYIQTQAKLLGQYLSSPKMAGPQPTSFPQGEEAALFLVRHAPDETGPMLHAQTYVRLGRWVGIVTLTTPESALKTVRPDYDLLLKGLQVVLEEGGGAGQNATKDPI